jgi:ABC-type sugar transport system ATPase subunit
MLVAEDVHKRFGPVRALEGARLRMVPGQVRALVGGNGSGKSTFAKVLTGVLAADRARLVVDGVEVPHRGPATAGRLRIAATYQEVALADDLSVAENLALDRLPRRLGLLAAPGRARTRALGALERVALPATVLDRKVRELPLDQRALAELAKLLLDEPRFAILDELTASLRREQVERVGALLRELTADGVAVLYVSHRLEEIAELCDAATVLRNGRTVLEEDALADRPLDDLVAAMTGAGGEVGAARTRRAGREPAGEPVLEVEGLRVAGSPAPVSLRCAAGEVVGLAGLSGHGQSELLRTLAGARRGDGGQVRLRGRPLHLGAVRDAVREGVGFLSGEREREMAFGARSVGENLTVVAQATGRRLPADPLLDRLGLPATHRRAPMRSLSGGNQQKVIVGRWLGLEPHVLLADDPTRGVDVATRARIHALLRELADAGSAVLLASSDDRELGELCDRVYVLYRGAIVQELAGDEVDEHAIAHAAVAPPVGAAA